MTRRTNPRTDVRRLTMSDVGEQVRRLRIPEQHVLAFNDELTREFRKHGSWAKGSVEACADRVWAALQKPNVQTGARRLRNNPLEIPDAEELAVRAAGSFSREDVEDFVDYCVRAAEGLSDHLQKMIRATWCPQQSVGDRGSNALVLLHGRVLLATFYGNASSEAHIYVDVLEDDDLNNIESTGNWSRQEIRSVGTGHRYDIYLFTGARAPWTARRYPHNYPTNNPRETLTASVKERGAELACVFQELIDSAVSEAFPEQVRLVVDDAKALDGRDPNGRGQAATDGSTVFVAEKLLSASPSRQKGVLAHELGHVHLIQTGTVEHSERDADDAAKDIFGITIRYDADDVQTTGRGVTPRPAHLKQNPGVAAPCCIPNPRTPKKVMTRSDRLLALVVPKNAAVPASMARPWPDANVVCEALWTELKEDIYKRRGKVKNPFKKREVYKFVSTCLAALKDVEIIYASEVKAIWAKDGVVLGLSDRMFTVSFRPDRAGMRRRPHVNAWETVSVGAFWRPATPADVDVTLLSENDQTRLLHRYGGVASDPSFVTFIHDADEKLEALDWRPGELLPEDLIENPTVLSQGRPALVIPDDLWSVVRTAQETIAKTGIANINNWPRESDFTEEEVLDFVDYLQAIYSTSPFSNYLWTPTGGSWRKNHVLISVSPLNEVRFNIVDDVGERAVPAFFAATRRPGEYLPSGWRPGTQSPLQLLPPAISDALQASGQWALMPHTVVDTSLAPDQPGADPDDLDFVFVGRQHPGLVATQDWHPEQHLLPEDLIDNPITREFGEPLVDASTLTDEELIAATRRARDSRRALIGDDMPHDAVDAELSELRAELEKRGLLRRAP